MEVRANSLFWLRPFLGAAELCADASCYDGRVRKVEVKGDFLDKFYFFSLRLRVYSFRKELWAEVGVPSVGTTLAPWIPVLLSRR